MSGSVKYVWQDTSRPIWKKIWLIFMIGIITCLIYYLRADFFFVVILYLWVTILLFQNVVRYSSKITDKTIVLRSMISIKELSIPLNDIQKITISPSSDQLLISTWPYRMILDVKRKFLTYNVNLMDKEGFIKAIDKVGFNKFHKYGPLLEITKNQKSGKLSFNVWALIFIFLIIILTGTILKVLNLSSHYEAKILAFIIIGMILILFSLIKRIKEKKSY